MSILDRPVFGAREYFRKCKSVNKSELNKLTSEKLVSAYIYERHKRSETELQTIKTILEDRNYPIPTVQLLDYEEVD